MAALVDYLCTDRKNAGCFTIIDNSRRILRGVSTVTLDTNKQNGRLK
jgi:hypothetical protein